MNNPIFIFSLNLLIECWFDYCFLKNYTFHKSTSEFRFFFFFSKSWGRASCEVQTQTNCLTHVRHFAASNQCNRPDLLEKTMLKLRSVYVHDWWISILGLCLTVSLHLRSVSILAVISIKGNEKRNRKW